MRCCAPSFKKYVKAFYTMAKRIALKFVYHLLLKFERFALCTMRYALFLAENTAQRENGHIKIENYLGSR